MPKFSFSKNERLKSQKAILAVVKNGFPIKEFPFFVRWIDISDNPNFDKRTKVTFTVSKKKFKKAVDRNLIKRRSKEAYRSLKPEFYSRLSKIDKSVYIIFSYVADDIKDFNSIKMSVEKILNRILENLEKQN